jgi:hypothetical protein
MMEQKDRQLNFGSVASPNFAKLDCCDGRATSRWSMVCHFCGRNLAGSISQWIVRIRFTLICNECYQRHIDRSNTIPL